MSRDLLTPLWRAAEGPVLSLRDWERLISQARRARLDGRLAAWFEAHGGLEAVPEAPRQHLLGALCRVQRLANETRWEADCLRRALRELPVTLVFLKGAAYVLAGLPPSTGRLFEDLDLLVPRTELQRVELALMAGGWVPRQLDAYDDRYYRDLMHELPPLRHIQRGSSIDVHHTITPPTSRFAVDAAPLLAAARPLPGQMRLAVLAPADMVLHSAVHLMQDGEFGAGMRDVLDVADLVRHFEADPSFWPELLTRAEATGLGEVLNDVLQQAARITGLEMPALARERLPPLAPRRWRNRLMAALLAVALRPDHPDCDGPLTGLCRGLLYARSHWLRMPWYQILPHLARKSWKRMHRRGDEREALPAWGWGQKR